jgi:hypothetical protein
MMPLPMTHPHRLSSFALLAASVVVALPVCVQRALGQAAPAAPSAPLLGGRPDRDPLTGPAAGVALGEPFQSTGAGIALQPPAGGKTIRRPGDTEFVRFVYSDDKAYLTVANYTLPEPAPLTSKDGKVGLLETAAERLKLANPGAEIVRQDLINIGDGLVGLLVARYTVGTVSFLTQQAIVQGSEQVYYTISYVTPGQKPTLRNAASAPPGPDGTETTVAPPSEAEQRALDTFAAVLDSVRLLDRSGLKIDQDQRLYRTRAFYVNLSKPKIEQALLPEQYFRIVRNGQDVGYVVVTEGMSMLGGFPAVRVATRTHTFVDDERKRQVYAEAWLESTTDRKHEKWSRTSTISEQGKPDKQHVSEIGASDLATKAVSNSPAGQELALGEKPTYRMVDEYPLTVKFASTGGAIEPVERLLPPWYAPQAIVHLLPRLVPDTDPKGYLFATYVPERREVMLRYIDVRPSRLVRFGGNGPGPDDPATPQVRATPIEDKLGIDGNVTTHYVDDNGKYLGNETRFTDDDGREIRVSLIATTATDLTQRWGKRANLAPPGNAPGAVKPAVEKGR